ncbi:MAG: hypothetical protein ACK4UO_18980 [Pseudolabrys sp.]
MLSCLARVACLLVALMGAARAGDLAEFNAAVEQAASHNRVAIGYLRTGNADLAGLELDRLREAWTRLSERFAGRRPDAFDGNPRYANLFTGVSARLVGTDIMLRSGRLDAAREGLNAVRGDLYALRQASGIVVLADCVRDANTTMDAFMVYNNRALDLGKPEVAYAVTSAAATYGYIVARCDAIAGDAIRQAPEFRRLVDGAKASLALIPRAIATRDADLLHRVLIELRSFDNLLAFRYG